MVLQNIPRSHKKSLWRKAAKSILHLAKDPQYLLYHCWSKWSPHTNPCHPESIVFSDPTLRYGRYFVPVIYWRFFHLSCQMRAVLQKEGIIPTLGTVQAWIGNVTDLLTENVSCGRPSQWLNAELQSKIIIDGINKLLCSTWCLILFWEPVG